ncbi:MAG: SUMF1/EgtB/PvdO family nonheme iron enzyme [Planctomycetota bacterium]
MTQLSLRAMELFEQVSNLGAAERARFLAQHCDDNRKLQQQLVAMLAAHDQNDYLEPTSPAVPVATDSVQRRVGPYELQEVIGEGGMGVVYRAQQTEPVRRSVAVKILRWGMNTQEVLQRFEIEYRALSLMSHPNIAHMYDAGATDDGRPYFVMEYVPGSPVTAYCDERRLTVRERLELFLPICHAVEHAHRQGVIHRDLKPSNLLVTTGEQGVPKVIDFGVAKATRQGLTDQTLHTELGRVIGTLDYMSPEQADPEQRVDARSDVYSLAVVLYELLVGGLPVQRSELRALGVAELQRALQQTQPPRPSQRLRDEAAHVAIAAARSTTGPALVRALRLDLDWIVLKALDPNPERRYESPLALAADIERYLHDEPVQATAPALGYRLRKWMARNKPAVVGAAAVSVAIVVGILSETGGLVAGAAALVVLVIGLGVTTESLRRAQRARRSEARQRELAAERAREAEDARSEASRALAIAEERLAEVHRLSDTKRLTELQKEAQELWPALPERIAAIDQWLQEARELTSRLPLHEQTLAALREQALPFSDAEALDDRAHHPNREHYANQIQIRDKLSAEVAQIEAELACVVSADDPQDPATETGPHKPTADEQRVRLVAATQQLGLLHAEIDEVAATLEQRTRWVFAEPHDQWTHEVLSELVSRLRAFGDRDPARGLVANVDERRQQAATIADVSVSADPATTAWQEAISDLAATHPGLTPQLGLLPLRRDPHSRLWEFWHVASGARPLLRTTVREGEGPWIITENTGIVLVLLPGGTFTLGAQSGDDAAAAFDPWAAENEGPPHQVSLAPFFISRYPMTQGQWLRIAGVNPSHSDGEYMAGKQTDLTYPVESVSWDDSVAMLQRLSLQLPTEAQWEYAARAGTTSPWWTGDSIASLQGAANVADRFAKYNGPSNWVCDDELFDGFVGSSSVGYFRPNAWGLHDVLGNVWEWCRDTFGPYGGDRRSDDGELILDPGRHRVCRGGGFSYGAAHARSATRNANSPGARGAILGLRPARPLQGTMLPLR